MDLCLPYDGYNGKVSIVFDSSADLDTVAIINAIQEELQVINQSVNTWDPTSYLSRYNAGDTSLDPLQKGYMYCGRIWKQ